MRRAFLLLALLGALGAACTTVEAPEVPTPEPDRVVGIDWQCTLTSIANGEPTVSEYRGESVCQSISRVVEAVTPQPGRQVVLTKFIKILTIRTSTSAYSVVVDGNDEVSIGMEWPPK